MNAWCVTKSQHEEARAHTHTDTVATSIIVRLHVLTGWKRPRMVRREQRVLYALSELLRGQQVIYAFHASISRTIQRLTGNLMRFRFMVWLTSGTLRICQRRILNKHCVISGWVTVIEGSNLPVDFFFFRGVKLHTGQVNRQGMQTRFRRISLSDGNLSIFTPNRDFS